MLSLVLQTVSQPLSSAPLSYLISDATLKQLTTKKHKQSNNKIRQTRRAVKMQSDNTQTRTHWWVCAEKTSAGAPNMTTMHAAGSWNSRYVTDRNIPLATEQLPVSSVCLTPLAEQTRHHKRHVMRSSHLASGKTAATVKAGPSLRLCSGSSDVDGLGTCRWSLER